MTKEEYFKSKKKKHNLVENQKLTMKINSTKNVSGNIGCVILLGGALVTAVAMGSTFLISRKCKKSTKKIIKKEWNDKIEDESNKGLHFILPDCSSPCMEQQSTSSSGTDKLYLNDNYSTSLFSTPCLIQDGKPKLDEEKDTLNAIVSDHPKGGGKSPSLELSKTKISLLPDPDQELDEVSQVRNEVIQGNEKTEVLLRVHQAQTTIFSSPALQMDNKVEIKAHNDDKGESSELQHTGVIETDNHEEVPLQEQEKQATGDQETSTCNEHEALNSAAELMMAADEDDDKDHLLCMYFEEQCADAETQNEQFAEKCDVQMKISDEEECAKESNQANSCYEEATTENSPCRTYSIFVPNLAASGIRNALINDEDSAEAYEDKDKGHTQIMYIEEQCADAETKIDQIAKEYNTKMQFSDEQVCSSKNDQTNSYHEEATSENSHCGTYIVDVQNLAASEIRNAPIHELNSAEVIQVIKETKAMDPAAGEQSPEADYSPIQLVEKQSIKQNCLGKASEEDNEDSKRLCMDIEVMEKDPEAYGKEVKGEVEDDDDGNVVDNDDSAQDVENDTLEGARNSSEQSNSDKICPADSNQEIVWEHEEKKVKEEEEGPKIKDDETCSVENCNLKSTQNDVAITSCQQSYDDKGVSAVNAIERYQMKLMHLDDIAIITRGRRLLLGALLVLIWYFGTLCLKAFFLPL
ncbi:putative protein isoform X1 [Capsicum annuum]|uniref:uncharacterized protein LOC107864059 isoform X1 n=1 Tax=Capsicum annuum TaxID=4072 RepID=UPI0007BED39E|nr:uncharacterized protein LOC107864059 isoform X1 [Capsicum annuum]